MLALIEYSDEESLSFWKRSGGCRTEVASMSAGFGPERLIGSFNAARSPGEGPGEQNGMCLFGTALGAERVLDVSCLDMSSVRCCIVGVLPVLDMGRPALIGRATAAAIEGLIGLEVIVVSWIDEAMAYGSGELVMRVSLTTIMRDSGREG